MYITLKSNDLMPSLHEGWVKTPAEISGRWKDITKYTRQMTNFELVQKWAVVIAVSVLSAGIFALYLIFSVDGQENLQLLRQGRMAYYVTLQTPPYLSALDEDVRIVIERFLPLKDFIKFRAVSRETKELVDRMLIGNKKRAAEIATMLVNRLKTLGSIQKTSYEYASFTKNSLIFSNVLLEVIPLLKTENDKNIIYKCFRMFSEGGHLTKRLLQTMILSDGQMLLDTFLQHNFFNKNHAVLYFEFAAPKTLVTLAEKALEYNNSEIIDEFYQEGRASQLRHAHQKINGTRERFLPVVLQFIAKKKSCAMQFIKDAMPDMSYQELATLPLFSNDKKLSKQILSQFMALKLVEMCMSQMSDEELRTYCRQLDKGIQCVDSFITEVTNTLENSNCTEEQIRRLIYSLNNCNQTDAGEFACKCISKWKDNEFLSKFRPTVLKEWTQSSDSITFVPNFNYIFRAVDSTDLLETLIVTSSKLAEPRRSLYLRALAHGLINVPWQIDNPKVALPVGESFKKCGLDLPEAPPTYDEFFQLNKSNEFFIKAKNLQSQQELEVLIEETLQITDEEQKKARLTYLGHGDVKIFSDNLFHHYKRKSYIYNMASLPSSEKILYVQDREGIAYALTSEKKEILFEGFLFILLKMTYVQSLQDYETFMKEVFELPKMQKNIILSYLKNEMRLSSLMFGLCYEVRKKAFENKGLDVFSFLPTSTASILTEEIKAFHRSIV